MTRTVFVVHGDPVLLRDLTEAERDDGLEVLPLTRSADARSFLETMKPAGALLDGNAEDADGFRLTLQLFSLGIPTVIWDGEPAVGLPERLERLGISPEQEPGIWIEDGLMTAESLAESLRRIMAR